MLDNNRLRDENSYDLQTLCNRHVIFGVTQSHFVFLASIRNFGHSQFQYKKDSVNQRLDDHLRVVAQVLTIFSK